MTRPAICMHRHLLVASFLEPQAHRFALLSPFSFLSALLFFSVSLPLLPRERDRVDSKVHCASEMFINERGAHEVEQPFEMTNR